MRRQGPAGARTQKEAGIEPLPHHQKKPAWLKIRPPAGEAYQRIKGLRESLGLATVCEEARCPNQAECWGGGTATFMLLGDTCTRGCRFCNVKTGNPLGKVDPLEPANILRAVRAMELRYVVLTMVDRDDLPDGGASHVAATIAHLKLEAPDVLVEILAGDFQGEEAPIRRVVEAGAEVFAHNLETVRRLSKSVRDRRCGYDQTLGVLRLAKSVRPDVVTKSSLMLGLGESDDEVEEALRDLRAAGADIVTLGQYLRPAEKFLAVSEFVRPERFAAWQRRAEALGFAFCASGPLVRSSYRAGELFLESWLAERRSNTPQTH